MQRNRELASIKAEIDALRRANDEGMSAALAEKARAVAASSNRIR